MQGRRGTFAVTEAAGVIRRGSAPATRPLRRDLGTLDAVMLGLGAMLGTGVFVSIGIGAGIAGPAVILALVLAAGLALCNGLSSAQLAAAHPVSGGTYEYGYVYLGAPAGFIAGWVFLIAKSASAATAALGFAGYLLHGLGYGPANVVPLALLGLVALTFVALAGIRRSSAANTVIVCVTLASLLYFVTAGVELAESRNLTPFWVGADTGAGVEALLEATALVFVAYTGYARIATLGEEVREPARAVPRAIVASIVLVLVLYIAVALVGIAAAGSEGLYAATQESAAPLAAIAARFSIPFGSGVLVLGALTAMLGVLLNLILGLSRVVLAMARRRDVPAVLAVVSEAATVPYWAVTAVAAVIAAFVLLGDLRTTWSFSAFAVLIYYSLTNLAALRMPAAERRYPRWVAVTGLIGCLGLAFRVEPRIWLSGLGLILVGLAWHAVARALIARRERPSRRP